LESISLNSEVKKARLPNRKLGFRHQMNQDVQAKDHFLQKYLTIQSDDGASLSTKSVSKRILSI